MTEPTFGIVFHRDTSEPRPTVGSDMAVLGIVLPSDDADPAAFPLDRPVDMNSNDAAMLAKIGTGPLYRVLQRVNAQLADLQVAARCVLVRVAAGATMDETIARIVGDQAAGTGLYALLRAGPMLGVIPRIIGAPGYTGHFVRASGGSTAVVKAAKPGGNVGTGDVTLGVPAFLAGAQLGIYKLRNKGGALAAVSAPKIGGNTGNGAMTGLSADAGAATGTYVVTCLSTGANGGTFVVERPNGIVDGIALVGSAYHGQVHFTIADGATDFAMGDAFTVTVSATTPANGGVFTVQRPDGTFGPDAAVGVAYASQVAFTVTDGATDYAIGDGFDLTVTGVAGSALANPICAALPAIASQLLAHAVVGGPGTTRQDARDWRETINSERLIPVDNWELTTQGEIDGAASVMGVGVRTDFLSGGVPSRSWANQPVQGLLGLRRTDSFSLTDGATDGQELLADNIGITVRGELGVETAAASSGFIFIGTDNAGDDELWRFYNVTRMRDYIHLGLLRSLRKRLGVTNITPHGIQAVENDTAFFLRDLKADEHILGYGVGFERDKNSPENVRLGRFRIFFKAEEPSVLRRLDIDSRRDREAIVAMLDDLVTQANTLVA